MSADFWFQEQGGGPDPGLIGNSLRFRGQQYLSRSYSGTSSGQGQVWTLSMWLKDSVENTDRCPFAAGNGGEFYNGMTFMAGNSLGVWTYVKNNGQRPMFECGDRFRDPSAWFHLVIRSETTNSNGALRDRFYINGREYTNFPTWRNESSQNQGLPWMGSATSHYVGSNYNGQQPWRGFIAEVHCCDGQSLGPEHFGAYNDDGVWVPIIPSGLNYGSWGFHLDFSDPNNIGADRSGNGNNFTANNFELSSTSSALYDWFADSPTNNNATFNPTYPRNVDGGESEHYERANNYHDSGRRPPHIPFLSVPCEPGGQYAFEINYENISGNTNHFPAWNLTYPNADGRYDSNYYRTAASYDGYSGSFFDFDSITGSGGNFNGSGIIGIVWDRTTDTLTQYINGVQGQTGTLKPEFRDMVLDFRIGAAGGSSNYCRKSIRTRNFRHNYNTDWELSTSHLPDKPITNPSEHFTTILDTGANILSSAQSTFPNGFYIIKDRVNSNNYQLISSLVGTTQVNYCPSGSVGNYATPAGNSLAWCWATDAAGLNATAGFQMVQYTGNGGTQRINHSLGVTPDCIWVYPVSGTGNAQVFHRGMPNMNDWVMGLHLNTNASNLAGIGNGGPDATSFGVGNYGGVNANGQQYIALLWREVPGFSFFGNSQSNNNNDGPFVYYGMRPGLTGLKATTNAGSRSWNWLDSRVNPHNGAKEMYDTSRNTGASIGSAEWDMLSNGFKWRHSGGATNSPSQNIIHMAWAQHPFGGSNVSPSPAR